MINSNSISGRILCFAVMAAAVSSSVEAELVWSSKEARLEALAGELKPLQATYAFKNEGDDLVTIIAVKPSCGCTTTELEKLTYEPGESGEIRVDFEVGDRVGNQVKEVVIRTDSSRSPVTTLTLRVDIAKPIELKPKLLLWDVGEPREPKQITLTTAVGHRIEIPEIVLASDVARIHVEEIRDEAPLSVGQGTDVVSSEGRPPHELASAEKTASGGEVDVRLKPQRFVFTVSPPKDGKDHRLLVRVKLRPEGSQAESKVLKDERFLVRLLADDVAAENSGGG